jgi:hypothetical protein
MAGGKPEKMNVILHHAGNGRQSRVADSAVERSTRKMQPRVARDQTFQSPLAAGDCLRLMAWPKPLVLIQEDA